jgi:predicted DNA-binding protein (UPF0251 family)
MRSITRPWSDDTESALIEDRAEAVRAAIDQLPPKQRMAITLVYLDGVTQKDAADRTDCAHDAFRRRLANGRTRLRVLLRAEWRGAVRIDDRDCQTKKVPLRGDRYACPDQFRVARLKSESRGHKRRGTVTNGV